MATIKLSDTAKKVLEGIHANMLISDIQRQIGVSRAAVDERIKRLMRLGLIRRLERGCPYEVTKDGENYID